MIRLLSLIGNTTKLKRNNVRVGEQNAAQMIALIFIRFADKQVFSDLDFLGWYTTGEAPTTADLHVHKQICDIYESPIMLQMNPQTRKVDVRKKKCVLFVCIL